MLRLLLVSAVLAVPALCCEHLPAGYAGSLEQTGQEAILFWKAGREVLILKNDFRIDPAEGGALPSHLAWVLPVPNVPDDYSVEDPEVFRALFEAWDSSVLNQMKRELGEDPPPKEEDLEVLGRVSVGEYEIQPIRARGEAGARALGDWLDANGFGRLPAENMAWYVERSWVWLAIRVSLAGGDSIVRNGSLRPLSIAFASEEVVYPVVVNRGQGAFDVNLYVVTEAGLELAADDLGRYGFQSEGTLWGPLIELPASLLAIEARAVRAGNLEAIAVPAVQKLVARGLGGPGNPWSGWDEDFHVACRPRDAGGR